MPHTRILGVAGLTAWLMVGLPVIIQGATLPGTMLRWAVAYVLFGALFVADLARPRRSLMAMEVLCIVVMVLLLCDGFEGTLLVLIAMRLPSLMDRKRGLAWIVIQTLFLAGAVAFHWNGRSAWLLAPAYFGFQILAFFTFEILDREIRTNAQLRAMQDLVADGGRLAERLRIARELHDALGHHLTALTLNLEAALVRTDGAAHGDVEKAQALARTLLADVRSIVAEKNADDCLDLGRALRTLVADLPRPHVQLEVDQSLRVEDPEQGLVILRCVQEVVTNAARHSGAENLWITVRRTAEGFEVRARDDGRGRASARDGFGLRGMRERIENAGGALTIESGTDRGFALTAFLPARSGL
ncbi:MAG TPA: sensor histidine kinase [Thermoanaerobaculia bacterium]|nr:sensor histidine kinase [Thermoanaerobaculia bacterium]